MTWTALRRVERQQLERRKIDRVSVFGDINPDHLMRLLSTRDPDEQRDVFQQVAAAGPVVVLRWWTDGRAYVQFAPGIQEWERGWVYPASLFSGGAELNELADRWLKPRSSPGGEVLTPEGGD